MVRWFILRGVVYDTKSLGIVGVDCTEILFLTVYLDSPGYAHALSIELHYYA